MSKFRCPECGSTQKKHSEEDCEINLAWQERLDEVDPYDDDLEDIPFNVH